MRLLVSLLSTVFWFTIATGQPKPAVVDAYKRQLTQAQYDSTRLRLCATLAQLYFDQNQYDSLFTYVQRGLQLLQANPSDRYASDLYFFLARHHRYHGRYQEGIRPIQQAVYHAQRANDVKKTAEFQYALAAMYSDAGDLSNAVDQIAANLAYLNRYEDTPTRGANYLLLITLYEELDNKPMLDLYKHRYKALDKRNWPPVDKLYATLTAGDELVKAGRFKDAGYQQRQAMKWARQTGSPLRQAEVLMVQADNFRRQHLYQPAIQVLKQAFAIARSLRSVAYMAESKRELAITYLAAGRISEALPEARYGMQLARQNKQRDRIMLSLGHLGDVLTANSLHREALTVYKEQQALKEAKFTENTTKQIARMQARLDVETKENTIRLLQKTAQIDQINKARQQQQLDLARRTQLGAVLIIGLLTVLVAVIFYFLRKSQHNYALLTQQQQLLQRTAHELAATNAVKDKLFSTISHDLRSPVARMKTNVRQIRETNLEPQAVLPLINRLEKQVDNVLALLTNLLDWSLIQLKGFHLALQPTVLHEIIEETISQASEIIEQKQLTIIDQVDKSVAVMADKHQLRSVVRNIFSNAVKFSPLGGYIRILTRQQEPWVELQIRDAGLGMSAEQLAVLFSAPDVRPGTLGESGLGLGLRICREMMDHQQGELVFESQPGKGTLVRIRLASPAEAYTGVDQEAPRSSSKPGSINPR